jgi:hypothetical protein
LANRAGGTIIYGLTEKDNKPDQLDPIKEKKFSREYLDQVIALGIQPTIECRIKGILTVRWKSVHAIAQARLEKESLTNKDVLEILMAGQT